MKINLNDMCVVILTQSGAVTLNEINSLANASYLANVDFKLKEDSLADSLVLIVLQAYLVPYVILLFTRLL